MVNRAMGRFDNDLRSHEVNKYVGKYMKGVEDVSTETRMKGLIYSKEAKNPDRQSTR